MDRWRAGTCTQCAEGLFNAPLPSPSSYFGDRFEQGNEEQIKEWREQVYKGYKGGPSIVHANEILRAAGAKIVSGQRLQQDLQLIRTRRLLGWWRRLARLLRGCERQSLPYAGSVDMAREAVSGT